MTPPVPTTADPPAAKPATALTEAQQAWLDPTSTTGQFFTPWPRDESIRRGALAQIQAARDRGVGDGEIESMDMAGQLLSTTEEAQGMEDEKEERKSREVEEEEERELRRRRERVSIAGVGGAAAPSQRPKRREESVKEEVFEGFELYNPDD